MKSWPKAPAGISFEALYVALLELNMAIYSHSKIGTYESCPQKYKFHYVDKIKGDIESVEANGNANTVCEKRTNSRYLRSIHLCGIRRLRMAGKPFKLLPCFSNPRIRRVWLRRSKVTVKNPPHWHLAYQVF